MCIKFPKSRGAVLVISLFLTLGLAILGICLGSVKLSPSECFSGLLFGEGTAGVIIRSLRLPRTLAALLSGSALGVSGLLLQAAVANPLCAPNTVGINSGAGAAVMLFLCFLPGSAVLEGAFAFLGALTAAALTLFVASFAGGASRGSVVLSGVAIGAIFNAVISFLSLRYPELLPSYAAFSVGGFSGVLLRDLAAPAAVIVMLLVIGMLLTPRMNLLALGDGLAESFGVRTKALRLTLIIMAAALASASVCFAGLIGFVGLVAPHASARIIGGDKRFLYPMTALFAASLTTIADTLSRVIFSPSELPAGVLLSAIGAPFFIILLVGKGRGKSS